MIDLTPTEEQAQLRQLAHEFAEGEIVPKASHHDSTGEFPLEILNQAWDVGIMNTHIPEEYGGLGLGVLEGCILAEEIGWACTGIGTAMEANTLAEAPVVVAGTEEQKKKWLSPMVDEFRLASYCVTEPDAGSDVAGIKMRAVKTGDAYVLNGEKMWITGAGHADWFFVLAYTDPEAKHRGMSAFMVPAKQEGVEVGAKEWNMGQRASDTRSVRFTDVKVPSADRLGKEGDGFKIAMAAFDHTRPVVASAAVGLARRAMEESVRYALERRSFGVPIASHQAISFMIADMAKDIEAGRLLVWRAATTIDAGQRNTLYAAYAKTFCADTAMRVSTDAVQIFGGYGYSAQYPVEKLMRDAKVFQIYEGTSQIQRMIIAREILSQAT